MISKEVADQLADFLEQRICYRRDDYALQLASGKYARMGKPLTHDDILAHVRGEFTVGVYQSRYPEERCMWVVYDIDHDDAYPEKTAVQKLLLKSILIDNGVPFYVEDSGSPNSCHLWVFFSSPTPLHLAYNWARAMVVRGGRYVFSGEIFPKQAALNSEKPYGNLVKVPFGIHQVSDRRTYFYDSSRGKPDDYMQDVETVDLSHWIPVDLPPSERSKVSKVPKDLKDSKEKSESNVFVDGQSIGLYRYAREVRPCITHMVQTAMQLRHYDGHMLRIAIASELQGCGKTVEQTVKVFIFQEDFDYCECRKQVLSVRGYNRPTCDRIRWHARRLESESGFKIDNMCKTCVFSETVDEPSRMDAVHCDSQEMNHAETRC